ncbi:MAG TPA: phosphotransferase [Candidatus Dormibacteraeota bacterium]|nr:phosphotransferase [Candidatus Dormibacteraeota bacterium]
MKSSPVPLPRAVREAAVSALGASPAEEDFAWLSWAGTVWRLSAEGRAVFVKRAVELAGERDRLAWLKGRWPVPAVVGYFRDSDDDWLITHALPGVPMFHASVGWDPTRVAQKLGGILRGLHATPAAGCPFGIKRPGHVLIHGDYCLPNVLVHEGVLSGLVDVGRAGLGNPEDDLAGGVWTLQYNYGKGFARTFLDAYGWPPMSDQTIEKLRRRYAR